MQFYGSAALSPAQMFERRGECGDSTLNTRTDDNICRDGYKYFDGVCYAVSDVKRDFSGAAVGCLPAADDMYNSRLAWTEKSVHLDFMASLARELYPSESDLSLWIGLDYMDSVGAWTTRYNLFHNGLDSLLFMFSFISESSLLWREGTVQTLS